jgi:malonyl-CoA/methylmalonyl-CoA synthetase
MALMASPADRDERGAVLFERLAQYGQRTALVAADGATTYEELDAAASRIARALRRVHRLSDEARVAISMRPGIKTTAMLLGVWKAGGLAVPLAVGHPRAELDYVIGNAEAHVVLSDHDGDVELAAAASSARATFTTFDELQHAGGVEGDESFRRPRAEHRALMLYTSGTTGRPKGVVTTHANIAAQIESLTAAWEWTSEDRALLALPLHHLHGLINILGSALWAGASCEMLSRFEPETVWARLASGAITVFSAVPTMYQRLIVAWESGSPTLQQERSEGCRRLRLMMSGSAALPANVLERWKTISGHTLLERYGMTELGMALSNPLHGERRPGFVGHPLPGVEARIVDEHGLVLDAGTSGELEVRGPAVFLEYWRQPDATAHAFRDGWFRTGDVAVVENGAYRLLGRSSVDIIKTGGEKVSAVEIEAILRLHPAIAECAVVGVPDERWGERVCLAAELRPGMTLSIEEVQAWTRPQMAPAKIPKELRCIDALPRNALGKVLKPQIAALFQRTPPAT